MAPAFVQSSAAMLVWALCFAMVAAALGNGSEACNDPCECGRIDDFPIQLLGYRADRNGEFFACPTALRWFKSIGQRPVSITSVVGNARIGKSFLVNNLLGRPQHGPGSFFVGHGGIGVTRGMWMAPVTSGAGAVSPNGQPQQHEGVADADGAGPLQSVMDVEGFEAVVGNAANFAEENDPKLAMLASTLRWVAADGREQGWCRWCGAEAEGDCGEDALAADRGEPACRASVGPLERFPLSHAQAPGTLFPPSILWR